MGRKRKVRCIETGKVYDSTKAAAEDVGLKEHTTITRCCKNSQKVSAGYHWEYYEESDLPGEIWKNAKCITNGILYDYSNRYMCSNKGRIKEMSSNVITYGTTNSVTGYKTIWLEGTEHRVHRIIATTFIPNPENKPTVDHIDTNPSNNCVENLRWFTQNEQMNVNEITKERQVEARKKNIKKMQEYHKKNGHKCSKENLKKAREANKQNGYKGSKEAVKKAQEAKKKKCICITTGEIFNSTKEAADKYTISAHGISACCRGESKSYKGKQWKYIEED